MVAVEKVILSKNNVGVCFHFVSSVYHQHVGWTVSPCSWRDSCRGESAASAPDELHPGQQGNPLPISELATLNHKKQTAPGAAENWSGSSRCKICFWNDLDLSELVGEEEDVAGFLCHPQICLIPSHTGVR